MLIILIMKHSIGRLRLLFQHCSYFVMLVMEWKWQSGVLWLFVLDFLWCPLLYFSAYCVGYVMVRCHRKYHSLGFYGCLFWIFVMSVAGLFVSFTIQCKTAKAAKPSILSISIFSCGLYCSYIVHLFCCKYSMLSLTVSECWRDKF